ncbi:MAG: aldo/keto reductase [Gemmatimonadetes bacterium 13_1_40CM_4_65_7]|nr:MAG: aldo/keto reductase [Gemmatimonadetes bacterium 13_1_40CM_4_65_7]
MTPEMTSAPNVERRDLSSDLSISRVLTGLWQLADMERDGRELDLDRAAAAMRPYVEAGLTTFDMADHYGPAEAVAGLFRSRAPQYQIQLFTKWVPKPGRISKAEVHAAVERALTRLGVEAIDLLQYHAWNYADPSWLETLYDLQDLKSRGLIRHLGLTNIDTAHLRVVVASGIDVVSNQVSFSLLDQRAAGGLAPFCVEHGVQLLAYGTLAGGWLTDRWLGAPEPDWERLPTWSMMKYGRFVRIAGEWSALQRVLKAAASVAARHGVSIANVASRYILDQPGVAGVIIGARLGEREHIDDTLRLFSLVLTDEDRVEIRNALATLQPMPGDCGDEYRKPPFLTASGDLSHHLDSMPAPYQTVARDRGRTLCLTGTTWEGVAGFARAVRQGRRVVISGTTATMGDRVMGGSDPAAQAHFVIDKIEGALQSLGATLADVIRTRVYVRNIADWEPVARAHGARFGAIQPANTLVAAALVGDEYLVEIEAEADVGSEER